MENLFKQYDTLCFEEKRIKKEKDKIKKEIINNIEDMPQHGTVHVDGGVVSISKKITWNQEILHSLHQELGNNAPDYIDVKFSISESKWKTFNERMKDYFMQARTQEQGTISLKGKYDE